MNWEVSDLKRRRKGQFHAVFIISIIAIMLSSCIIHAFPVQFKNPGIVDGKIEQGYESLQPEISLTDVMNPDLGYYDQELIKNKQSQYVTQQSLLKKFDKKNNEPASHIISGRPDFKNGTTWYVDDEPGIGPGNPPEDFMNIQDAIDYAEQGDTIFVYNGVYYERIQIRKSLKVIGENNLNTIIHGIKGNGGNKFSILDIDHADFVTIQGFTFHNGSGLGLSYSSDATIRDNLFISNGIYIFGDYRSQWTQHIIENNTVNGKPIRHYVNSIDVTVPADTGQVILANCSHSVIQHLTLPPSFVGIHGGFSHNITVMENNISHNWEDGIAFYHSADITITNNKLYNNSYGVVIYQSINNVVDHNIIHCKLDDIRTIYGIFIGYGSMNNVIENNTITGKNDNLFLMSGIFSAWGSMENIIRNNNINNVIFGIYLAQSSENQISSNTIMNNQVGIFLYFFSDNNTIERNVIHENLVNGIYACHQTSHLEIRHNSIQKNLHGIQFIHSSNNYVIENNCSNNMIDGIGITEGSHENLVQGNICSHNMKGIVIKGSIIFQGSSLVSLSLPFNNLIRGNICEKNHQGILLNNGFFTTVQDNQLLHNGIGVYLYGSSLNMIEENDIHQNSHKGVTLRQYSLGNVVKRNSIGPWNYQGLYLERSHGNLIHHNIIMKNNDDGIGLVLTFGNRICFNNFIENTNLAIEGLLCFDVARFNYWDGHRTPHLRRDILVAGVILVHPCFKRPLPL